MKFFTGSTASGKAPALSADPNQTRGESPKTKTHSPGVASSPAGCCREGGEKKDRIYHEGAKHAKARLLRSPARTNPRGSLSYEERVPRAPSKEGRK